MKWVSRTALAMLAAKNIRKTLRLIVYTSKCLFSCLFETLSRDSRYSKCEVGLQEEYPVSKAAEFCLVVQAFMGFE